MTFRFFKAVLQKLLFFVFACMLPLAANSTTEEELLEKRIGVAMRMIGHEVLLSLGDCESRIMPIEKTGKQYKISFESEFGFDPGDIVSIIDRVMSEARIATGYLVEVEQCETKAVVHSFEIGTAASSGLIPCGGRMLPEDCYRLLITFLNDSLMNSGPPSGALSSAGSSLAPSKAKKANPFKSALLIVPLLILLGVIGYSIKKKHPQLPDRQVADSDPNLVSIGAFRFDKRTMTLSFEDNRVELSNKEAELLSLLHTFANAPIAREVMLQRVWGDEGGYVGRTLDVFISKLRKKLEADTSVKIVNIRGVGYKLVTDVPG